MRLAWIALLMAAGCGGGGGVEPVPPDVYDGSYSGTWDSPLMGNHEYGTMTMTVSNGAFTARFTNTVTNKNAKVGGSVAVRPSEPDERLLDGVWKWDGEGPQPFACTLTSVGPGSVIGYCRLDDGLKPKKFGWAMTLTIDKD